VDVPGSLHGARGPIVPVVVLMPAAVDLLRVEGESGVVWSVSPQGFHSNLVVLEPGGSIGRHRNDALDVLFVVLAGAGQAVVDTESVALEPGIALLVPRGADRSISAGPDGLRYLTVHAERGALTIGRASAPNTPRRHTRPGPGP
jgi:mannose-6-phosphate isomerase-like protein (cupin superfamily)